MNEKQAFINKIFVKNAKVNKMQRKQPTYFDKPRKELFRKRGATCLPDNFSVQQKDRLF